MTLLRLEVRVPEDFKGAFEVATRQRAGALFVPGDPLVTNRPRVIADLALKYRLPTIMDFRELPEAGGLLSFGPDLVDSYRRAATHVDKILRKLRTTARRCSGVPSTRTSRTRCSPSTRPSATSWSPAVPR